MSVFGRNADNVLRDLSHASAWGQCVTVHYDNKTATRLCNNVHEKMWCAVSVLSTTTSLARRSSAVACVAACSRWRLKSSSSIMAVRCACAARISSFICCACTVVIAISSRDRHGLKTSKDSLGLSRTYELSPEPHSSATVDQSNLIQGENLTCIKVCGMHMSLIDLNVCDRQVRSMMKCYDFVSQHAVNLYLEPLTKWAQSVRIRTDTALDQDCVLKATVQECTACMILSMPTTCLNLNTPPLAQVAPFRCKTRESNAEVPLDTKLSKHVCQLILVCTTLRLQAMSTAR